MVGATGMVSGYYITPTEEAPDYIWDSCRKQLTSSGFLCFANGSTLHCPYGPAKYIKNEYFYYIKGVRLGRDLTKKMQAILKKIELAPLYLNHKTLKYPARWMLQNYGKPA